MSLSRVFCLAAVLASSPLLGGDAAAQTPKPGSGTGKGAAVQQTAGPDFVEVIDAKGARSQVSLTAIKKASSGPIQRRGDRFEFTPLLAVMKLANVPPSASIRVTGTGGNPKTNHQMFLGKGANFDPVDFGFIFNLRGRPVLTPRAESRHATAEVTDRPQVVDVISIAIVAK